MYVREIDHRRALGLLEVAAGCTSRTQFAVRVLPAMCQLFGADEVSYSSFDVRTGRVLGACGYPTSITEVRGVLDVYLCRPLEHPYLAHLARTRDPHSVRLADLCSRSALHRTAFYQDFFRPRGIEYAEYHAIALDGGQAVGFALSRGHRDFGAAELDFFEHLRRPLGRIWTLIRRVETATQATPTLAAIASSDRPGLALTPAEQRVVEFVLRGYRTVKIANALHVSEKAVEQHLTRIFRKAEVTSRTELVIRCLRELDHHDSKALMN